MSSVCFPVVGVAQVEGLIASNEQLMRENEVFVSYLNRHMPVRALPVDRGTVS